ECISTGRSQAKPPVEEDSVLTAVMRAFGAVVSAALHAAALETTSVSRKGRGHCGQASRSARHLPRTMRCPRFTRVSDGKPFLCVEERSKGRLIEGIAIASHVRLPWLGLREAASSNYWRRPQSVCSGQQRHLGSAASQNRNLGSLSASFIPCSILRRKLDRRP